MPIALRPKHMIRPPARDDDPRSSVISTKQRHGVMRLNGTPLIRTSSQPPSKWKFTRWPRVRWTAKSTVGSTPTKRSTFGIKPFQRALGAFTYLMLGTHPDIPHTLIPLSPHTANSGFKHLLVLNRLFHIDADLGSDDHKSTFRHVFVLTLRAISWSPKQQDFLAPSPSASLARTSSRRPSGLFLFFLSPLRPVAPLSRTHIVYHLSIYGT